MFIVVILLFELLFCSLSLTGAGCIVSLPQNNDASCQLIRQKRLAYERLFYRLSAPKPEESRSILDPTFPYMNQSTESILARTMLDPFTAHWFNVYFQGMLLRNNKTFDAALKGKLPYVKFSSYEDYKSVYNFFMDAVAVSLCTDQTSQTGP